mmetsp:Transcript_41268/g.71491  ORF Transcript_41268/g.71491 Transcript_41268/m.71491 type:complete len:336 (+) Transcript_41268:462-1469(+)
MQFFERSRFLGIQWRVQTRYGGIFVVIVAAALLATELPVRTDTLRPSVGIDNLDAAPSAVSALGVSAVDQWNKLFTRVHDTFLVHFTTSGVLVVVSAHKRCIVGRSLGGRPCMIEFAAKRRDRSQLNAWLTVAHFVGNIRRGEVLVVGGILGQRVGGVRVVHAMHAEELCTAGIFCIGSGGGSGRRGSAAAAGDPVKVDSILIFHAVHHRATGEVAHRSWRVVGVSFFPEDRLPHFHSAGRVPSRHHAATVHDCLKLVEIDRAFRLQAHFFHDFIHIVVGVSQQNLDVLVGDAAGAVAHSFEGDLQILFFDALSADCGREEFMIGNLACLVDVQV